MNRLTRPGPLLPRTARALLVAALAVGCVAVPRPASREPPASATPPAESVESAPPARVVRYYRDEQGQLWDDQGRRVAETR